MKARAQLKLTCRRGSEVELAQHSLEQLRLLAHTLKSEYKWYSDLLFDLDGVIDRAGGYDEMREFVDEYLGITDDYTQRLEVLTQLRIDAGDDAISSVASVRPLRAAFVAPPMSNEEKCSKYVKEEQSGLDDDS